MAINLKDHAIFIDRLQMEMVPLSIAQKAVTEALESNEAKIEEAIKLIENSFFQINKSITEND